MRCFARRVTASLLSERQSTNIVGFGNRNGQQTYAVFSRLLSLTRDNTGPRVGLEESVKQRASAESSVFSKLGLGLDIVKGVVELGIEKPTEIQELFIPRLLKDNEKDLYSENSSISFEKLEFTRRQGSQRNYVIASETGSGKTLAFLLPIIEAIKRDEAIVGVEQKPRRPKALIIVPTRELAVQIGKVVKSLSHSAKVRVGVFTGGIPQRLQNRKLETPLDIVVATPGRALALRDDEEKLFYGQVRYLVVDEADAMVGAHDGFREEMEKLLMPMEHGGKLLNRIWVGATILSTKEREEAEKQKQAYGRDSSSRSGRGWIKRYAQDHKQEYIELKTENFGKLPENLRYRVAVGSEYSKYPTLLSVLRGIASMAKSENPDDGQQRVIRTLVFCNTIPSCQSTVRVLEEEGELESLTAYSINGSMPPVLRDRQWDAFNRDVDVGSGFEGMLQHKVLVCTDIAARGLDFDRQIDHVVMLDLPDSISDFIHRIGRTARGVQDKLGTVTMISKSTNRDKKNLELLVNAVPSRDGSKSRLSMEGDIENAFSGPEQTEFNSPVPIQLHKVKHRDHRHTSAKHSVRQKLLRKKLFDK